MSQPETVTAVTPVPAEQKAFSCPECEAAGKPRTFQRAAALGAHRRTHGVLGVSHAETERRKERRKARQAAARERAAQITARLDEPVLEEDALSDALIRTLFPRGVPPNVTIIDDLMVWVREAERLKSLS